MNKRLDLARQALRLLPSKTNPRVKRWQAPDEAPTAHKPRGKADLSRFVLDPNDINEYDIEMVLETYVDNIPGLHFAEGTVGDYLGAKEILGTAERMAKETERIKEFLENSDNPRLQQGLARAPIHSLWALPSDELGIGSFAHIEKKQNQKLRRVHMASTMGIDPVQAALFERLPQELSVGMWDERSYTPEQMPWHETAHLVDGLQSGRVVAGADDFPSLTLLSGVRKSFEGAIKARRDELIERVPRLQYPLAVPAEYFPVLTEVEVTNPEDIDYLQDVLGEDIRGPLRKLHGNTLPHRPWKKP